MLLSNRLKLPQPLVSAISNDPYSRGKADISVTQLISPPRQVALIEKHQNEIVEDVSDRIWSLIGQSVHTILERANLEAIAERRLSINVLGWTLSGAMDAYYSDGHLQDYKITTAYKFKNGEAPQEHEQQLNILAEILRQNGEKVTQLSIVGILRDWSKLEAKREASYPNHQIVVVPVPLWHPVQAQSFIEERIRLHQSARIELPECSHEERWARPDVWAVKRKGKAAAERGGLYSTEKSAKEHASRDSQLYVEFRPGQNVRCESYCKVASFCEQYADLKRVGK